MDKSDIDKRFCKDVYQDHIIVRDKLLASGEAMSEDELREIRLAIDNDYSVIREYCTHEHLNLMQHILLLVAKYLPVGED